MTHAAHLKRGIRAGCSLFMVAAAVLSTPGKAAAQATSAQEELRLGLEAAARGDTAAALGAIDRALVLQPDLAEAHFQRGLIFASQASHYALEYRARLAAQEAFEAAIRVDPANPRFLLELGKLMLKQQIRLDARRVFERALEAAQRADAKTLAETHYQIGIIYETAWERLRYRYNLPIGLTEFDADHARLEAEYVWRLLTAGRGGDPTQGELDREGMLAHYHAALAANPQHSYAAAHLLAYLYDEGFHEQFIDVARRFAFAAPQDPVAHLVLGLADHRAGRSDDAAASFNRALELMPESDRVEFNKIGRILSRDEEKRVAAMLEDERTRYRSAFWSLADPVLLTAANEFWLEYMARMAYADIRFGIPEYNLRGWETDRGVIYVRYGEPVRKATFAPSLNMRADPEAGRVTTVWTYGEPGPVFVFRQNPGYRRATFAGDFSFYADNFRAVQPATFHTALVVERLELPMQLARFRGADGGVDLEVYAAIPYDRIGERAGVRSGEIESGLFVRDEHAAEHTRMTRTEVVDFAERAASGRIESWRTIVPPGRKLNVAVEARDPLTWTVAAARAEVDAVRYPPGRLSISDLLLADLIEPQTAQPRARSDFRIDVNPALEFGPNDPISLYFELYNLQPDAEHFASYDVQLTVIVKEIYRTGAALRKLLGDLADLWGLTPEGGEAVRLRFNKDARVLARDVLPEHLQIQIPEPPPGRYALRVLVRDRNANTEYQVEREFEIAEER